MTSQVVQVHSAAELAQLKQNAGTKLVVVYYTAAWCGPCQQIRPRVDQFSLIYPTVSFAKVDIDELQEVAQIAGVRAVPTFEFYKSNVRVAAFAGAEIARLEALIKQHKGGEAGEDASSATGGMVELNAFIDKQQINCLNQSQAHPFTNVLTNSDSYLESDADEQLLLDIPFQQVVKLHSIKIVAKHPDFAPKTIKIFANRINVGFEDAESDAALQEVDLNANELSGDGATITLKFVRFQRVNNVVLFIKNNQGDEDVTRINHIKFFGQLIESTDMKELKKADHHDS